MPRQVDNREQQVADFGGRAVTVAAVDIGLDLVRLFTDLGQHRERIVPIEPDLAGLLLKF